MACTLDEDVRPVTLLVHNTGKVAFVVEPRGGRRSRETLDTTECRILNTKKEG